MSEVNADRRRSPRFACGGRARISFLPSDGTIFSANLRNLSLGGTCLDTNHPMDPGARAEVLVSVNASSFRTLGLIKRIVGNSRACMEFVQMSAGSRDVLTDLLAQMARLQAVVGRLRSARVETEEELFRQLGEAGVRRTFCGGVRLIGSTLNERICESGSVIEPEETSLQSMPLLIRVDFFG